MITDTPQLPSSPARGSTPLRGAHEPTWLDDGTPYSAEHADVYYTRGEGLSESRHVFLEHNALARRWAALPDDPATLFVIGETGFGTGLNFLLALQLWNACAPPRARLLFRSLEACPLSQTALERALAAWPELAVEACELLGVWPPALEGLHHLEFSGGHVQLQLYLGEAADALADFSDTAPGATVDAWFLDGFAPARNPAMWQPEILRRIGTLTRTSGTLATFTAAAAVREGLTDAGFVVSKVPGFGRKRDMIAATRSDTVPTLTGPRLHATPWHRSVPSRPSDRTAVVIGAGIAGCTAARALAARGWQVSVLEAEDSAAAGASGNPQGILFTQLQGADSPQGEFTLASYLYATRYHAALLANEPAAMARCGLLQVCEPGTEDSFAKLGARYAQLAPLVRFLDIDEASSIAGVALNGPAAFLPAAGWIDPRRACAQALAHPSIRLHAGARVTSLERHSELWHLACEDGREFAAPVVVLANARAATTLLPAEIANLHGIRGQVTLLPARSLPAEPRAVVCGDGYLVPPAGGIACCGASFLRGLAIGPATQAEQQENLHRVAALLRDFAPGNVDPDTLGARVAERCASPDRLPLAGRVPDVAAFTARFAGLGDNARRPIPLPGAYLPGLALSIAHGSRGLTSAPLCAELVAAELSGEPLPVSSQVARAVAPARFLVRRIIKGSTA